MYDASILIVVISMNAETSKNLVYQLLDESNSYVLSRLRVSITLVLQSAHETKDFVDGFPPQVKVISTKPLGSSRARNVGANSQKADYTLFLDDDVKTDLNLIKSVWTIITSHNEIAIIAGCVYKFCGKPYNRQSTTTIVRRITNQPERLCGACMLIKSSIFEEIGGFNTNFGVGCEYGGAEELIFLSECAERGYEAIQHPKLLVYHPSFDIEYNENDGTEKLIRNAYGFGAACAFLAFKYKKNKYISYFVTKNSFVLLKCFLYISIFNSPKIIRSIKILKSQVKGFYEYSNKT